MKKALKWIGIGFLAFVVVIMVYAFLGKKDFDTAESPIPRDFSAL